MLHQELLKFQSLGKSLYQFLVLVFFALFVPSFCHCGTFHVLLSLLSFCTQFALFCKYSEECKRGQDVGIRRAMGLGNMQVAKKMQKEGKKRKKRHNLRGHKSCMNRGGKHRFTKKRAFGQLRGYKEGRFLKRKKMAF